MKKMKEININNNNYEAFFLDFWENTLSKDARKMLSQFLEANPELQDEFLDFRDALDIKLDADQSIKYPSKQNLIKPEVISTKSINQNNFEDFLIGFIENDLTAPQKAEFKEFMSLNSQLVSDLELYRKTILKPEKEFVFPDKESLKQKESGKLISFWLYATAVAAMLLIGFIILNPFANDDPYPEMAKLSLPVEVPERPLPKLVNTTNTETLTAETDNAEQDAQSDFDKSKNQIASQNAVKPVTKKTVEIAGVDRFMEDKSLDLIKFQRNIEKPVLASVPISKENIPRRTEMDGVFNYPMLRDEMLAEKEEKKPGAVQRVFTNLGNVVFGGGDKENESLLGQIADAGRERINEIKDDAPKLETMESEDARTTYFAINENLKIRIRKANKANQPRPNQK